MSTRLGFFIAMGLFAGTVVSILTQFWAIGGALIGGLAGAGLALGLDKLKTRR